MHFEPPKVSKARTRGTCARSRTYHRKSDCPKIDLDGKQLKEVLSTKFLGVVIDNKLNWQAHVDTLHKKLKSATGILNNIMK